jgi:RimJ/RimL family protein N-acetyltransferase
VSDRRPITPSLPAGDQINSPRLVLRDGTVASIRAVTATDRESIRQFFHDLSPDSRRKRFFTPAEPSDSIVERMADSSDPQRAFTLIVHRLRSENLLPVAIASYFGIGHGAAEVAFAVDDRFHGKGLATLLLERLAIRAAQNGFEKFQATTLVDNMAMLEVFRDSGFAIRSKTTAGVVELQLSLTPSAEGVRSAENRDRAATAASLVPMLTPRGVAVIGVSRDPFSIGRRVFEALRAGGFTGPMYPVNPNVDNIDGIQVYRSARDLPEGTDLAVVVVPWTTARRRA